MKNNQAFTLIELLVVVLIIGILASVALPQYKKAVEKARGSEVLAFLQAVLQAEQVYFSANGEATNDWETLSVDVPAGIQNPTGHNFQIKDTEYRFCTDNSCFLGKRTYKSQTYILQANFVADNISWEIVCAAPEGNNICQLLGFSATSYADGGYGKYYRKG